jgi:hypothetical protein
MNTSSKLSANDSAKEATISNFEEFRQYIRENSIGDRALSARGLSELCGIHHSAVIMGGDFKSAKLSQKLAGIGFESGYLLEHGFNADASWAVVEYYAYESQAKAPGAKKLARLFGALGVAKAFEIAEESKAEEPSKRTALKAVSLWEVRLTEARNVMLYRFLTLTFPPGSQSYLLDGVNPEALEVLMRLPSMTLDYLVAAIEVKELHQERLYQMGVLTSAGMQRIIAPSFDLKALEQRLADAEGYLGLFAKEKKIYEATIARADAGAGLVGASR